MVAKQQRDESFKLTNVFVPQGYCASVGNDVKGMLQSRNCKLASSVATADVLVVRSLSRINDVQEQQNHKGESVKMLHHDMFCARLLGLRVVTDAFFEARRKTRKTQCSVKLVPAYLAKRICFVLSDKFCRDHHETVALLTIAEGRRNSKFVIVRPSADSMRFSKSHKVVQVSQLPDVRADILSIGSFVDRHRSGGGKFVQAS